MPIKKPVVGHAGSSSGPSVDRVGAPVVDPTDNVMALVAAAVQRQDDLREKDLFYTTQIAELRSKHTTELFSAESKRIDAIRAVDVNAVAVASQRAADQATVLATQVAQSAEALRVLVATTAATVATAQQQLGTTLSSRITTLEQSQYEGKGKQAIADPMIAELSAQVKALAQQQTLGDGKTEGISASWAVLAGATGIVATVIATTLGLYTALSP